MKKITEKIYDPNTLQTSEPVAEMAEHKPSTKKRFKTLRPALICLLIFTLICGVIYPLSVTIVAQAMFPYEANGSQIVVTLKDGTKKTYGSELIGQDYESAEYLFGRINTGAPTNLSPSSDEYKTLLEKRIAERKEKLALVGYADTSNIPFDLLSSSGSGVDPHISPNTAKFQISAIVVGRNAKGWKLHTDIAGKIKVLAPQNVENLVISEGETLTDFTENFVTSIVKKYTEGRFLGIFGEKRVNVLLVNLSLDGII